MGSFISCGSGASLPSQQNGGAVGSSGATSMVTATVVETNADQSAAIVGSGPGESTAVAGDDCTVGMHARDGPDTGTAGTADRSTAGADAVESRPDTGTAGTAGQSTAGRSPGPASQGSRSEGRTRLGSEGQRDEVVVVVVARCGAQG